MLVTISDKDNTPKPKTSLRKMESEVIRMCIDLFNGDDEACGSVNKSYRDGQQIWSIGCVNPMGMISRNL